MNKTIKGLAKVSRLPFLILPISLIAIAISISLLEGVFDPINTLFASVGLLCLHVAVNSINEYSDSMSGIDDETDSTPFSGGSKAIQDGLVSPHNVLYYSLFNLFVSFIVGLYFINKYPSIVLFSIIILGAVIVIGYTDFFAKYSLGEITAGIGLGSLPVFSIFYVQQGVWSYSVLLASIPPFFLTFNLLLLNEFPDYEVDKNHGRRNILTVFDKDVGKKIYLLSSLLFYFSIIIVIQNTQISLLTLLTLPSVLILKKIIKFCVNDSEISEEMLKKNVIWVIVSNFLYSLTILAQSFL